MVNAVTIFETAKRPPTTYKQMLRKQISTRQSLPTAAEDGHMVFTAMQSTGTARSTYVFCNNHWVVKFARDPKNCDAIYQERSMYRIIAEAYPALMQWLNLPVNSLGKDIDVRLYGEGLGRDGRVYQGPGLIWDAIGTPPSLRQALSGRPLSIGNRCRLLLRYLEMSTAFAKAGFIDTDEKPDNVLVEGDLRGDFRLIKIDLRAMQIRAAMSELVLTLNYAPREGNIAWSHGNEQGKTAALTKIFAYADQYYTGLLAGNLLSLIIHPHELWDFDSIPQSPSFNDCALDEIPDTLRDLARALKAEFLEPIDRRMDSVTFAGVYRQWLKELTRNLA